AQDARQQARRLRESRLSCPAWLAGRTCRPRSPRLSDLEPDPRLGELVVSGEWQADPDRCQRSRQRRQRGYVATIGNRRSGHPAAKRTRGRALHPRGAAAALAAGRTRSGDLPVVRSVAARPSSASQSEGLHRFSDRAPGLRTVATRFHRAERQEKAPPRRGLVSGGMRKEGPFSAIRQFGSGSRLARKLREGWVFDVPLVALLVTALLAGEFLLYY